ncbi:hypothetical protein NSQ20_17990 [Paenibacillus sp. FSL K6-1122]
MLQAHDQRHVDEHTEERTMFIPTGKVTTTKFNLTEEDQRFLLQSGHVTATKFLESWNFETYKNKFRQNHAITPMELYFAEQQEGHKIYQ